MKMNMFTTPQWESSPATDKTCRELFQEQNSKNRHSNFDRTHIKKIKRKNKKGKKSVDLQKLNDHKDSNRINLKKKKNAKEKFSTSKFKTQQKKPYTQDKIKNNISQYLKKQKNEVTLQTLFTKKCKSRKHGTNLKQKENNLNPTYSISLQQKSKLSLRERMLDKLKGARFRYINEHLYTSQGKDAKKYFDGDPDAYTAYHDGYRQQVERWPLNPLDVIIDKIKKLPQSHIIADFGCGDAKLAKSVPHKVHSFDFLALDQCVTACDMAHVPLQDSSIDVVVFCLSLMGTNLKDYLFEANRVLKVGGLLKIAEVESRFENVDAFIKDAQSFGFSKKAKDFSHNLFCFLDFIKKEVQIKNKNKLANITLAPCLYKKR